MISKSIFSYSTNFKFQLVIIVINFIITIKTIFLSFIDQSLCKIFIISKCLFKFGIRIVFQIISLYFTVSIYFKNLYINYRSIYAYFWYIYTRYLKLISSILQCKDNEEIFWKNKTFPLFKIA